MPKIYEDRRLVAVFAIAEEEIVPLIVLAILGHIGIGISAVGSTVGVSGLFVQGDVHGHALAGADNGNGGGITGLEAAQGAGQFVDAAHIGVMPPSTPATPAALYLICMVK